jgi:hypothetical protein
MWTRVCVTERLCVGTIRSDDISAGVTLVCDILRDSHYSIIDACFIKNIGPIN